MMFEPEDMEEGVGPPVEGYVSVTFPGGRLDFMMMGDEEGVIKDWTLHDVSIEMEGMKHPIELDNVDIPMEYMTTMTEEVQRLWNKQGFQREPA